MPPEYEDHSEMFEEARIIFRNFEGKEGPMNTAGNRNFCVVLTAEQADDLERKGYNVKRKPPREDGDEEFRFLKVKVSFKGRPPRIVMLTSRGRTTLDEDLCQMLDVAEIESSDLIIQPYKYTVNGKTGISAYLKSIYVTIHEDALELKYANVREIGGRSDFPEESDEDLDEIDY